MSVALSNAPKTLEEDLTLRLWDLLRRDGADVTGFLNMLNTVVTGRDWSADEFLRFVRDDLQTTPEELRKIIHLKHKDERPPMQDEAKMEELRMLRCRVADLLSPEEGAHGGDRRSDQVCNTNLKTEPVLNTAAYKLRRLKRDRPDLAAKVIAGELSAHAAAREAGFAEKRIAVPLDPARAAGVIWRHFSREEVEEIIHQLQRAEHWTKEIER